MTTTAKIREAAAQLTSGERSALKAARRSERGIVLPALRDGGALHQLLEKRGLARGGVLTPTGQKVRLLVLDEDAGA